MIDKFGEVATGKFLSLKGAANGFESRPHFGRGLDRVLETELFDNFQILGILENVIPVLTCLDLEHHVGFASVLGSIKGMSSALGLDCERPTKAHKQN